MLFARFFKSQKIENVGTLCADCKTRYPPVLDAQQQTTPAALQAGPCAAADQDAVEALAAARARFLKSAESFLPPCLQEAVLMNLARDDPLASPNFESE